MMFNRLQIIAGAVAGGVAVFGLMMLANSLWIIPAAKEEGRDMERTAAIARSMEIIKERTRTNAQVNALTDADLCRELGGLFENGECR